MPANHTTLAPPSSLRPRRPRWLHWCATAVAAVTLTAPTSAREPEVAARYGPAPDWRRYQELGEAAVLAQLIDPDSAKVRWPNGYVRRGFTPFMRKRVYGYATCGYVNSRNRMGGYAGEAPFAIVIDDDQVLYVEVGSAKSYSLLQQACSKGLFPPASTMVRAAVASGPRFAFALTGVPDGAYVASVAPGSGAAAAGLAPGMVVTRLNGVGLRGMALTTVEQMLAGADGPVTLDLVGGKSVQVAKEAVAAASSGAPPEPERSAFDESGPGA